MRIVSKPPSERRPQRMADLSVLPVFFTLTGKRVVVIGGTDAAAWKAELIAATGAEVHIYAAPAGTEEELPRLLAADEDGRLIHHEESWTPDCLEGAALVVADAADDEEATALVEAARKAGVPVNVIDKPAFCQFQFGSIVNRSPAVIGISTAGAAPILGQAIRRRIETLLPLSLADWAKLAARLRDRLYETLETGAPRRAFWERFVDRAFGNAPEVDAGEMLLAEASRIGAGNDGTRGRVTLVGAGPGDAELLTVKAIRALQAADVILFDELVSDDVLELARREAKHILVGKRGGRRSCRQEDINAMMVKLARGGKRVVRLKAGDPMIFGRGGEEIVQLEAARIPVDIVPGITAALAMASSLRVSLTHRDLARSVRFVTGHSKSGGLPEDLDWRAVADPTASTIFYMGGRMAARIAERLLAEGLSPETPVAVASAVSRPDQRLSQGRLADLEKTVLEVDTTAPVIIGIGGVFGQSAGAAAANLPLLANHAQ
ncbi:Siroheme synthase [Methyloligella halotolerans]|uniref:Siroheme synthase n=1 Tax=Methyloligella halotolerans TaxID=1177755 RepID=A0A1E2RVQ1_9HYPH|nr:siroheme synthase CysG [Methyloligella halotolerans]ODA66168.1 Siroheme synthase [Methyloligella halotolerans]